MRLTRMVCERPLERTPCANVCTAVQFRSMESCTVMILKWVAAIVYMRWYKNVESYVLISSSYLCVPTSRRVFCPAIVV